MLELCEAASVACVITLSSDEAPEDLADFVEYCFGGPDTPWGATRRSDGRAEPYAPFTVEIGNEQPLDDGFLGRVERLAASMAARARRLELPPLRLAVGQNIGLANFKASLSLIIMIIITIE